ncbi:MAG: hypothetical protein QM765_28530 [Myxococcales bacterium]
MTDRHSPAEQADRSFEFFLQFHREVPRQGPGTPEATADAFRRIAPHLPPRPASSTSGAAAVGRR